VRERERDLEGSENKEKTDIKSENERKEEIRESEEEKNERERYETHYRRSRPKNNFYGISYLQLANTVKDELIFASIF